MSIKKKTNKISLSDVKRVVGTKVGCTFDGINCLISLLDKKQLFSQSTSYYEWCDPTWAQHFLPKLEQLWLHYMRNVYIFMFLFVLLSLVVSGALLEKTWDLAISEVESVGSCYFCLLSYEYLLLQRVLEIGNHAFRGFQTSETKLLWKIFSWLFWNCRLWIGCTLLGVALCLSLASKCAATQHIWVTIAVHLHPQAQRANKWLFHLLNTYTHTQTHTQK